MFTSLSTVVYIVTMVHEQWTCKVFTTRFNIRCQMVTPLLNCRNQKFLKEFCHCRIWDCTSGGFSCLGGGMRSPTPSASVLSCVEWFSCILKLHDKVLTYKHVSKENSFHSLLTFRPMGCTTQQTQLNSWAFVEKAVPPGVYLWRDNSSLVEFMNWPRN